MDSIGFTTRYNNELVEIGHPSTENGYQLIGADSQGPIHGGFLKIEEETEKLRIDFPREIDRGTELTFECIFKETDDYVQSCYLDNRLGIYVAIQLMETLQHGIIAFSCWEEHGRRGCCSLCFCQGNIETISDHPTASICDITWVTSGVHHGEGCTI